MQYSTYFICSRHGIFHVTLHQHVHTHRVGTYTAEGEFCTSQIPTVFKLLSQSSPCRSPFLPQLLISLSPNLPCAQPPHLEASAARSPSTCLTAKGSNPHLHEKVPFPLLNAPRNDAMQYDSFSIHPPFKSRGFLPSAEFLKQKGKTIRQHPLPEPTLVILDTTCPCTIHV